MALLSMALLSMAPGAGLLGGVGPAVAASEPPPADTPASRAAESSRAAVEPGPQARPGRPAVSPPVSETETTRPPEPESSSGLVVRVLDAPTAGVLYLELHAVDRAAPRSRRRRWDAPVARMRRAIEPGDVEVRFESLPPGRYALRVYLDQNGNQRLEPVGFSNDARARLGPPRISAASFDYRPPLERVELRLTSGAGDAGSLPAAPDREAPDAGTAGEPEP